MSDLSKPKARILIADSRSMPEVGDETIDLIVTSPPYWHIKDYGVADQIGYGQDLHAYLIDLYRVWCEAHRVLRPGARLCINIGDQFARAVTYGRYRVIPLHAEIIAQCETIGFDFLGSIIWQKRTTMNPSGGANIMGSFPYPPNGIIEIDYEYIHIFRKVGRSKSVPPEIKERSRLTKTEWKQLFKGHWSFGGARKLGHEAMFPVELPRRLIKMFTFVGDTVLDPFLGSGTTVKAALEIGRNAIGYEINEDFMRVILKKLGIGKLSNAPGHNIEITRRRTPVRPGRVSYSPRIGNLKPTGCEAATRQPEMLLKVTRIINATTIGTEDGKRVRLLGIKPKDADAVVEYLRSHVLGKQVLLKFDESVEPTRTVQHAYVYLKNRIFINGYLLRSGLAYPDKRINHRLKERFEALSRESQ